MNHRVDCCIYEDSNKLLFVIIIIIIVYKDPQRGYIWVDKKRQCNHR